MGGGSILVCDRSLDLGEFNNTLFVDMKGIPWHYIFIYLCMNNQ